MFCVLSYGNNAHHPARFLTNYIFFTPLNIFPWLFVSFWLIINRCPLPNDTSFLTSISLQQQYKKYQSHIFSSELHTCLSLYCGKRHTATVPQAGNHLTSLFMSTSKEVKLTLLLANYRLFCIRTQAVSALGVGES